jgi:GNAT superfamily N-acetyltransferase
MLTKISFSEFQRGIFPLWGNESDPTSIPIYNNPYGIFRYSGLEQRDEVIFYGVKFTETPDGPPMAYSSIYNISPNILRIRGIYVLPEFRNRGIGHRLVSNFWSLFPNSFTRIVGFWRDDSYERFIKYSNMKIVPETSWFWSSYTGVKMKMLYCDNPNGKINENISKDFIKKNHSEWSFGGTKNLDKIWTDVEWRDYIGNLNVAYPVIPLDLNYAAIHS